MASIERKMAEDVAHQETGDTGSVATLEPPKQGEQEPSQQTSEQSGVPQAPVTWESLSRQAAGQGGNGGTEGGGGGGRGPEGPREPELPRGPEWETSPERGRKIVEDIINLRTDPKLSYAERYALKDEQGHPCMAQLYKELQDYVNAISRERNERDPWDRYARNSQGIVTGVKEIEASLLEIENDEQGRPRLKPPPPQISDQYEESVTDEERASLEAYPLQTLLGEDANPATPADRRSEIQKQLSIYFGLAKEKGLLKGVDQVLESIYKNIKGVPADQARRLIAQRIGEAQDAAEMTFDLRSMDQEVVGLYGVWNSYIRWARRRFELMLQGQNQPEYGERNWEFQLPKGKGTEIYWEIGNYPKYYRITANNREQMLIAKESFLRRIKKGSLGKSPEAIYQHVDNFKEVFGQRGGELVEAGVIDDVFLTEQRQELEAQLYIFGADYSNETYNPKQYKEFMTAMALHEGPQRWVRLLRAGDGQVAAFTHMFDKEALMEIFNNPVGERGELDIIAQHFLQHQIQQMAIERGMGVVLKDYDPKDPNNTIRFMADDEAGKVRAKELKANLDRIGLHMSDEEFKNLFEGFDKGDVHILDFQQHRQLSKDQLQQLPEILRDSIALGRIQLEINKIRLEVQQGTTVLKKGETLFNKLLDGGRISKKDIDLYKNAYAKAEVNFNIAFQMQGASGEKVRRGRGFFYVDRNPHIQAYQAVQKEDDIKPDGSDLTLQQKRSRWWNNSQWLGWMISELREGRAFQTFSREEQYFYYGLGEFDQVGKLKFRNRTTEDQVRAGTIEWIVPADRENFVDHIPVYLAEKFVQYAVTRTKVQYANFKAKDRTAAAAKAREYAIEQIKKFGWQAQLTLPKILFDAEGNVLDSDSNQPETVDFQKAVKHIYSRYTTHTYWGYQGENRQMILRPELFEAAKRIRAGWKSPEDEDVLASQLLIIDPTLKRVKRFKADEIQREITLFQAAVEESFLGHVDINKALFKAFLPKDGARGKMRAGYNMEDWGGMMRFTMGIKELSASQPARFSRRLGAEIAIMPIYTDSMAAIWGQDGVMGAVSMFADKIEEIGGQRMVSQFGIAKFIDQQDYAVALYNALIGSVQEGKHVEGLYMKPTNDNDALHRFAADLISERMEENLGRQLEFLQQLRSTFGRLETVLKIMRPMYSDVRNAGGALRLENVDIFLDNGKFNPDIERNSEIYMNTGTSRHLASDFYNEFADWLISELPGGGGQIYPEELIWNRFLKEPLHIFKGKGIGASSKTFKRWFFEKAAL